MSINGLCVAMSQPKTTHNRSASGANPGRHMPPENTGHCACCFCMRCQLRRVVWRRSIRRAMSVKSAADWRQMQYRRAPSGLQNTHPQMNGGPQLGAAASPLTLLQWHPAFTQSRGKFFTGLQPAASQSSKILRPFMHYCWRPRSSVYLISRCLVGMPGGRPVLLLRQSMPRNY